MIIRFFGWYGGKLRVVLELLACIPDHITAFYEACAGSAVVTLNKVRPGIEMVSDLDPDIVHLFTVMADRQLGGQLVDRLLELRYSREAFMEAKRAEVRKFRGMDDVTKAVMIFILITQSFNNTRETFREKGPTQRAYAYAQYSNIPWVYERMENVRVRLVNCIDVVEKVRDNPHAMVYLDLPYRHKLRAKGACDTYGHEMSDEEHKQVLEACRDAKCCILICGYHDNSGDDMYDRILGVGQPGSKWSRYIIGHLSKSCQATKAKGKAKTKSKGEEHIWVNYPLPDAARFYFSTEKNPANRQWTKTPGGVIIPSTLGEGGGEA